MASRTNPLENLKLELPKVDFERLDLPSNFDELESQINTRLDEFEAALPTPFDSMFRLQRAMFDTTYTMTKTAASSMNDASSSMMTQARASAQRLVDSFNKQMKMIQGDATRMAGATRNAATDVVDKVDEAADEAADRVEKLSDEAVNYNNWTKDELYDAAQELDIQGRSSMSKKELADAVRKARRQ